MRVCSATTTASAVCNKLIIIFLSELNLFYSSFTFSVSIPLQVVFRLRRIFRQKQFLPLGLFRRTPGLLLAAGLTLFLTFLVGEAVPNTLFQILEIIEILL